MKFKKHLLFCVGMMTCSLAFAQGMTGISSVLVSANQEETHFSFDQKAETAWSLNKSNHHCDIIGYNVW